MFNKTGRPDFLFLNDDVESPNDKSYCLVESNTQMLLNPTAYFPGFKSDQYPGKDWAFASKESTRAIPKITSNVINSFAFILLLLIALSSQS